MSLLDRIADRSAVVAVIGLGYVGLPLTRVFVGAGFRVLGLDVDAGKIAALRSGRMYLSHLGEGFARDLNATGRFEPTSDAGRLSEADAIIIAVPTPLAPGTFEPDLSYVEQTTEAIARALRPGQLIVLESTTYPGTTREVVLPRLLAGAKGKGLTCGRDEGFYLAFSPEREDPGRADYTVKTIPKLVGGVDAPSARVAAALYATAIDRVIEVGSAEIAESAKLLENIYRAVNIAMVNELKVIFDRMGINIWEVIAAASTKPFGFQTFYPGPGLGGHCIPIDPFYLSWKAKQAGAEARFVELAGKVNHEMPGYVVERTVEALRSRGRKIAGARVLILGLAYKPDIDDVRESPSFELIEAFSQLGAAVEYHDPHVPRTHRMRRHDLKMTSIELTATALGEFDAVVVSTAHSAYDWAMIVGASRLVIDTRNATAGVTSGRDRIVLA
ncbi:MAG: nucleotide sugar dehydrogenase [Phycisphaerales bacterium]